MLAKRFLPYSVNLNTGAGTALWINQIDSTGPDGGVALFEEATGSEIDRMFVAAKDVKPKLPITTSDLSVLTTIGMGGVLINPPGLTAYGRLLPTGAAPTVIASSSHLKLIMTDGLLVPVSVRAAHNQAAKLQLLAHAIRGTDGASGATPFVYSTNSTITAGAAATANLYTTGPVKFGTTLLQGIQDINVTFGIDVLIEGDSGEVYPSIAAIIMRMAKVEFVTSDVESIVPIGDGLAVSSFGAYFRQVAQNGQRVDVATTTHIKVAGTAGMITAGSSTFAHRRGGTGAYTYTPSGTTQLAISAAAIPTS